MLDSCGNYERGRFFFECVRTRLTSRPQRWLNLGPPPTEKAIYPNRMSPAGISMLYAAEDEETAIAAYRLKYSRWIHVVLVPNERVEALVRRLLDSFAASGGVPLRVVCDNPEMVIVRHEEGRPVWNPVLGPVAIDYGFTIELCTPRQRQQKGAVENLVGFVKRAFFRARRFTDLTADPPQQLAEWLVEVNTTRLHRATKEIPAVRLYPDRVKIITAGSKHDAVHPRFPTHGTVSYLPGQRAAPLAAVAGARKRLYFMGERILELGPVGEGYLTELIHQRPHTWKGDVERLFALLEELGDTHFRLVLQRALFQRLLGAEYVVRLVARLASTEVSTEAVS
ncbi:MAG: RES domain-containing protein [Gemmatimonadaceae bacterium]